MIVSLYENHHQLPFWHGTNTNPFDVFNPKKHKNFPFKGELITEEIDGLRYSKGNKTIPFSESKELFSFLVGLHNVETSDLIAHVSAMCSCEIAEHGYWHYPNRVWVQITTLPHEFTNTGIPVVYNMAGERNPEICGIWGYDNGTYNPYQFLMEGELREKAANNHEIWTRFFC